MVCETGNLIGAAMKMVYLDSRNLSLLIEARFKRLYADLYLFSQLGKKSNIRDHYSKTAIFQVSPFYIDEKLKGLISKIFVWFSKELGQNHWLEQFLL